MIAEQIKSYILIVSHEEGEKEETKKNHLKWKKNHIGFTA